MFWMQLMQIQRDQKLPENRELEWVGWFEINFLIALYYKTADTGFFFTCVYCYIRWKSVGSSKNTSVSKTKIAV